MRQKSRLGNHSRDRNMDGWERFFLTHSRDESIVLPSFHYQQKEYCFDPHSLGIYPVQDGSSSTEIPFLPMDLSEPETLSAPPRIRELVFLMSQDCNMRCVYCYAQKLNLAHASMSFALFQEIIDHCFHRPPFEVERIILLGGEPLLNHSTVMGAIQYLRQVKDYSGMIGLVTNGTIIRDEDIDEMAKLDVDVTVSLDGPQTIHDQLRPFPSGKGTYARVIESIERLDAAGIPVGVEGTYTSRHLSSGFTLKNLLDFYESIGVRNIYVALDTNLGRSLETLSDEMYPLLLEYWRAGISYALERLLGPDPLYFKTVMPYLEAVFLKKRQYQFCKAGTGTITFYVDGRVYPCYFCESGDLTVSQLTGDYDLEKWLKGNRQLLSKNGSECASCWMGSICTSCAGMLNFEAGKFRPLPLFCGLQRAIMQETIAFIIKIQVEGLTGVVASSLQDLYGRYRVVSLNQS